ncbi:nucleoside triphosphate pyrophosphatase [Naasia sp. SYSU D00057]|uniref:Maf family protein n=1 Tax=Naasia sp. SYSU D00057 TaxID=2817380 RepID=UPI001B313045|nr:nucleoside triphosphate pyrophosphatase [Naasia sp. SYSU D00057]
MRLYLASTSPARLALLRSAGIEPIVVPSSVDEPAAVAEAERQHGPVSAREMVLLLARAKAEAVAAGTPDLDGLVIGGDSAFELDGAVYGKPHRPEIARERWLRQRGRTGLLHSGHWLVDARKGGDGRGVGAVATASVTFATDIRDEEIDAYIATGEPLAVAGAFTIDSLGGPFIDRIEGDPSTVVGLSLPTLRRLLHDLGVTLPELWNRVPEPTPPVD